MAEISNSSHEHHYITLQKAIHIIKVTSETQLEQIKQGNKVQKQAFIIYSLPGIGKSESLKNLAKTPEHIRVIDINAEFGGSLAMPIQSIHEVNGDAKAEVLHALHEDISKLKQHALDHPNDPHYLFLDEFNRGDEFMKQTLMQLLLNTKVPGHDLPNNVFVVGAGNTASNIFTNENVDNEVNPIDVAGRDRIAPFFVQLDAEGWLRWAYQNNVHEKVIRFIETQDQPEEVLYQAPQTIDGTGATPRSWTKLSGLLDIFTDYNDLGLMQPLVASQIGTDLATKFVNFLNTEGAFSIRELLSDPNTSLDQFEALNNTDKRQALMLMPRFVEKHLASNNIRDFKTPDNVYKAFNVLLDTKDQQILERFIRIFFETDDDNHNMMSKNYPILYDRLQHSKRFMNLAAKYSMTV